MCIVVKQLQDSNKCLEDKYLQAYDFGDEDRQLDLGEMHIRTFF